MENKGEIVIYQTQDGLAKLDVLLDGETVWITQDQMTELFQRDKSTISRHIRNIFVDGELDEKSVVAFFATTASDGKTYQVAYYNLDVIISVGYRVKSQRGVQFRQWATKRIHEYIVKGFTLDDDAKAHALGELKKFKERRLSPAEEDYMETIRELNKEAKKHLKE